MRKIEQWASENKGFIRVIAALLVLTLTISTFLIQGLRNKNAVAYLYDESTIQADYSVAQLAFDLSSDHMYTFFENSTQYQGDADTAGFCAVLDTLNTQKSAFDNGLTSIENLDDSVKTALKSYYGEEMIDGLQDAWNQNGADQAAYNSATRLIYNAYYTKFPYLFKIKNMQISSVEEGKSIWYYYAADLLETFFKEFVSQTDATGTRQSTIRIGAKLKGGTTYSADPAGTYYDPYFNDMVTAFTMKLTNTGNVFLYLNQNFLNFVLPDENHGKGVLGLVLPYGQTWENLLGGSYASCYDAEIKQWNYRELIRQMLASRAGSYTSSYQYSMEENPFGTLDYSSTEALLDEWNTYAISTYYDLVAPGNTNQNIIVYPQSSSGGLKEIPVSVLFWADYAQAASYYASQNSGKQWRSDDSYQMIPYQFVLDIKTSLKNSNLNLATPEDMEEMFNKEKVYDKYTAVSNFDAEGYVYFVKTTQDGTTAYNAKNYMEGGYIICNYVDPTAVNYIANLRFNVQFRGYSPAYVRVRLIEQFTNTMGEIEAVNQLKFKLADPWADNRADDMYFYSPEQYYSADSNTLTVAGKAKLLSIPVIEGLDPSIASAEDIDPLLKENTTMTLRLSFYVEAVQPNRTEAYWDRTAEQINAICSQET